jgi:hypothetical protein
MAENWDEILHSIAFAHNDSLLAFGTKIGCITSHAPDCDADIKETSWKFNPPQLSFLPLQKLRQNSQQSWLFDGSNIGLFRENFTDDCVFICNFQR